MKRNLICTIALWCALVLSAGATGVVSEVKVAGNVHIARDAITAVMALKPGSGFDQSLLDRDRDSIERLGFFSSVELKGTELEPGKWSVLVQLSEYAKVKEIKVTGNTCVPTEAILRAITVKPGQVFNAAGIAASTAAIRKLYTDKGYFVAGFDRFAPAERSPETIEISIVEMTVGSVTFRGNTKTKDWVLRRLTKTRPGEVFSEPKWRSDGRRIANTQWFADLNQTESLADTGVGKLDLGMKLKEEPVSRFDFGAQLDPSSGLAGMFRAGLPNFQGTGKDLGFSFMQTASRNGVHGGPSMDFNFTNPFYDSRDTALSLQVYSRLLYRFGLESFGGGSPTSGVNQYSERRTGGSLSFTRPFSHGDFYGSLGFKVEDVGTGDLDSTSGSNFIQQDGRLAVLTIGTVMNRRDVDIDSSRGDWLKLSFEPGLADVTKVGGVFPSPSLLGTNAFLRSTAEYRRYWSAGPPRGRDLFAPRSALALRLKVGSISGNVPFFEQFFSGGAEGVRGFDEDRFWGKNTFLGSLEFRYPVDKSFSVIPFMDYGGAWGGYGTINTYTQTSAMDLHLGYGLGFSFRVPRLGTIRLDFGMGDDGKSRTYFRIAPPF